MITATYKRDKKLRIRKEPYTDAEVIGFMRNGDSTEVLDVDDGWCKIADGCIMRSLVSLTKDDEKEEETTEPPMTDGVNDGGEDNENQEPTDDEAAELRKMTNPQLYDLCMKSGIKVKKNANKEAMIAALINPDE